MVLEFVKTRMNEQQKIGLGVVFFIILSAIVITLIAIAKKSKEKSGGFGKTSLVPAPISKSKTEFDSLVDYQRWTAE